MMTPSSRFFGESHVVWDFDSIQELNAFVAYLLVIGEKVASTDAYENFIMINQNCGYSFHIS
jgi:hypothetical protein